VHVGGQCSAGSELTVFRVWTESVDVTDTGMVDGANVSAQGSGPSTKTELYDEATEELRAWVVAPGLANPNGTGLGALDCVEL
jgi:hypothetical protein